MFCTAVIWLSCMDFIALESAENIAFCFSTRRCNSNIANFSSNTSSEAEVELFVEELVFVPEIELSVLGPELLLPLLEAELLPLEELLPRPTVDATPSMRPALSWPPTWRATGARKGIPTAVATPSSTGPPRSLARDSAPPTMAFPMPPSASPRKPNSPPPPPWLGPGFAPEELDVFSEGPDD